MSDATTPPAVNPPTGAPAIPAVSLAAEFAGGGNDPVETLGEFRARIEALEPTVGAWIVLDWDFATAQAETLRATSPDRRGPLYGLPVAVKDMFDTCDLPAGYGSGIYAVNRPGADAAAVAALRAAGAIIPGKTVSTEFAYWKAGKTRNPLDPARSPGGSSSGTAAAVASGMTPLGIGTQTAASTIRPASYCGIVGFKPTRGRVSLAGAKALCNSLDHVGLFARSVSDVSLLASVLMGDAALHPVVAAPKPPRFAILRAPEWAGAQAFCIDAVDRAAEQARGAGADVTAGVVPAPFESLCADQKRVMAVEAARELAHERRVHGDRLSQPLQDLFHQADAISADDYVRAMTNRDAALATLDAYFAGADFLLAPSTDGEAPLFDDGTGGPDLCRAWTLLGLPSITIPCGRGPNGLPTGLQIAAGPWRDGDLLAAAAWFERLLNKPAR
ncbi:MAG: amidase [Rhodospirillaceae bacterium]